MPVVTWLAAKENSRQMEMCGIIKCPTLDYRHSKYLRYLTTLTETESRVCDSLVLFIPQTSAAFKEETCWVLIVDTRVLIRRLHFDLIMRYKVAFNIVKLDFADFISFIPVTVIRGHAHRIFVPFAKKIFLHIALLNLETA